MLTLWVLTSMGASVCVAQHVGVCVLHTVWSVSGPLWHSRSLQSVVVLRVLCRMG